MEILKSVGLCIAKVEDKATVNGYNVGNGLKKNWVDQSKRDNSFLEQIYWLSSL